MSAPIQEIKDRLDIVEFIRAYIRLMPAGRNFKALCPFHKEKTPSFIVSPDRQTWHCFGSCAEGGDVFKFLMKHENLEFHEALKILAEKAGIELKRISSIEQRQFDILYEINEAAKNFFKKNLGLNKEAIEYLKERGLKNEIIEEFELGFALPDVDKLTLYLIKSGYNVRDIERAGLNFKTERGGYIDRFRGRIMFPIFNSFGKIVGFSGRILPRLDNGETGKYINSPETPIFNKSKILYGLHKSKNFIKEKNAAILVEGQMDFLMVYSDEVKNAVATSGTALTPEHLKTLRRYADNLIFCFDNDEAGLKAAERSIDLANSFDFSVKLFVLKHFKDPAEMVQKEPGKIKKEFESAQSAMDFYFSRYLYMGESGKGANQSDNFSDIKKNIRIILMKIKALASPIEQSHWLKKLSDKTGAREDALIDEMKQLKIINRADNESVERNSQLVNKSAERVLSRRELISQRLLSLAMTKDNLRAQLKNHFDYLHIEYLIVAKNLIDGPSGDDTQIDEDLKKIIDLISLRSSFEPQFLDDGKIELEYIELLRQLKLEYFREKGEQLIRLMKEAETKGDETAAVSARKEFDDVSKMMHN